MEVPQGRFELRRVPDAPRSPLRAWDAADEYLLGHLADGPVALDRLDGSSALVINDAFGALAVGLTAAGLTVSSWTDSTRTASATARNLERNGFDPASVSIVPSTDAPPSDAAVVAVKVPKSLSLLEHQLRVLAPHLASSTPVVGAGMVKHLPRSAIDLFDDVIGTATTSLAKKKARLVFAEVDGATTQSRSESPSPWPRRHDTDVGLSVMNHAGVFSNTKLDIGTRFLLEHLPPLSSDTVAIDLGCGNGILGTALAKTNPGIEVHFVDVSHLAVASARATHELNESPARHARFVAAHTLERWPNDSVDCVVLNPPFHDDHAVGDQLAWGMFTDARRVLRPGGELRIVANRHLGHHTRLRRLFGDVDTIASNAKFVVLSSHVS